jgi:hypothetical protein
LRTVFGPTEWREGVTQAAGTEVSTELLAAVANLYHLQHGIDEGSDEDRFLRDAMTGSDWQAVLQNFGYDRLDGQSLRRFAGIFEDVRIVMSDVMSHTRRRDVDRLITVLNQRSAALNQEIVYPDDEYHQAAAHLAVVVMGQYPSPQATQAWLGHVSPYQRGPSLIYLVVT